VVNPLELLFYLLRFVLHLLIVRGIWLLVKPLVERNLRDFGQKIDFRIHQRMRVFGTRVSRMNKGLWVYRHLDNLLYFAHRKYEPGISVMWFLMRTVFLFTAVFLSGLLTLRELPGHLTFNNPFLDGMSFDKGLPADGTWRFPLYVACISATLPYFRMRYLYAQRKVRGSYDLLDAVKISTKFTHLPVDVLLMRTADFLTAENVLKTPLRLLGTAFANYSNERELHEEAGRFSRTIGTTFAVEFISDLLYSEKEGGLYLKNSLMMLNRSMEQQRETILTVKAGSRDAISLGLYGNLVVLVASVGTFIYMIRPDVYFRLQFQTSVGLTFLVVILTGLFVSFVISTILAKPKLDYH
jgi:hypothetical protein